MDLIFAMILLFLSCACGLAVGLAVFDYMKGHSKTLVSMKKIIDQCDERTKNFKEQIQSLRSLLLDSIDKFEKDYTLNNQRNKDAFLAFSEKIDELEEKLEEQEALHKEHKEWAQTFSDDLHHKSTFISNAKEEFTVMYHTRFDQLDGRVKTIQDRLNDRINAFDESIDDVSMRLNRFIKETNEKVNTPKSLEINTKQPLKVEFVPHVVNKLKVKKHGSTTRSKKLSNV